MHLDSRSQQQQSGKLYSYVKKKVQYVLLTLCAICANFLTRELMAMAKNTTINIRVDSEVKEQAGKILDIMGMTFSEAFNLMLHQVKIQRALPFDVVAFTHNPKPETLAYIDQIENGSEQLIGPFSSKEELWKSLGI